MKIYVVGPSWDYANWIKDVEFVHNIEDAQIVLFTGGADVSPSLYGCAKDPTVYSSPRRDEQEVLAFRKMRPDQLAFGTCRGLTS
jgi:Predicted glutamine amidotransferases